MLIKKSQIQSIVITKDREFKHRSITFLNNIAFNAEKISVDNISEAVAHIEQNAKILNLIIDGKDFYSLLDTYAEELKKLCGKTDLVALMFVDKAVPEETLQSLDLSNLFIKRIPFEKGHFNEAFHSRGGKGGSGIFSTAQQTDGQKLGLSHAGLSAAPAAKQKNKSKHQQT